MTVIVEPPATSANLGPGFDCLGLALGLRDEVRFELNDRPEVTVSGEGAGEVASDTSHLVYASAVRAFETCGMDVPTLRIECRNRIPHGRGLGSSSAAIVAGLAGARALGADLDDEGILEVATAIEGHPDNVAPALLGGLTIAWTADGGKGRAQRLDVHPGVRVTMAVPAERLSTSMARGLLPRTVSFDDAVFAVGRTALMVAALTANPDRLWEATRDRLHQDCRRSVYPGSWELVEDLRRAGVPAAISGAGPSVIAFAGPDTVAPRVPWGWAVLSPAVESEGVLVRNLG